MNTDRGAVVDEEVEESKPRGRGCGCWVLVLLLLLAGGGASAALMGTIITREETPLPGEAAIADLGLRYLAVPGEYTDMRLPNKASITTANGKALYQASCIICHGQNGSPAPQSIGASMYPYPPDLKSERTRTKTDGQLFWILAHGVNLTGMPAWGKDYGSVYEDDELWSMVKFIREEFHNEKR